MTEYRVYSTTYNDLDFKKERSVSLISSYKTFEPALMKFKDLLVRSGQINYSEIDDIIDGVQEDYDDKIFSGVRITFENLNRNVGPQGYSLEKITPS